MLAISNPNTYVITPRQAGKILGRSQQSIEEWLRSGTCPFGTAHRNPRGRWMYVIPVPRFEKFLYGEEARPDTTA